MFVFDCVIINTTAAPDSVNVDRCDAARDRGKLVK